MFRLALVICLSVILSASVIAGDNIPPLSIVRAAAIAQDFVDRSDKAKTHYIKALQFIVREGPSEHTYEARLEVNFDILQEELWDDVKQVNYRMIPYVVIKMDGSATLIERRQESVITALKSR